MDVGTDIPKSGSILRSQHGAKSEESLVHVKAFIIRKR